MVAIYEQAAEKAKELGEEVAGERHIQEDKITTSIERMTSKVPSATFLTAAMASVGVSLIFALSGKARWANFVGQWVPTILILGLYNKMVKEHEPD